MIRIFVLLSVCLLTAACGAGYSGPKGFNTSFADEDNSSPNGYSVIDDPTQQFTSDKVERFRIVHEYCDGDDCKHNSRRAVRKQDIWDDTTANDIQPKKSWYGWYLNLPKTFDPGLNNTDGFISFLNFKHNDLDCGTSIFQNNNRSDDLDYVISYATGGEDKYAPGQPKACKDVLRQPIYKISDMRGKWTKFEMFANWENSKNGEVDIFINGKQVLDYNGIVCPAGCDKYNFLGYGLYIGNVQVISKLKASEVMFTQLSRSTNREDLLVNKSN